MSEEIMKDWLKRKPHREICSLCHEVSRVGLPVIFNQRREVSN
jgi:hypothetical protein